MTTPGPVPAIVLAAGASRRLGRPKQMVEFRGEALLARAIRVAREAGARPVFVVLGAYADEIRALVPMHESAVVMNEFWQEGMASSIRAGLRAASEELPGAEGVLLMSCDQPRISSDHLALLLRTFEGQCRQAIVASAYAEVRGIPAVFPRSVFPQLQALVGDSGARRLLVDPPCALVEVPFEGGEIDIDEPADLAQLD